MEAILHILGVCGDTHSHADLLDIFFGGALASGSTVAVKYYWNAVKVVVKNKLTTNNTK
jgi:hypothetical protein